MIDHVFMHVKDYDQSKRFYTVALKPLGYELVMEDGKSGGLGAGGKPDFWIGLAQTRKQVDGFYEEAIAAGGQDNGGPGLRKHYHQNYYAAFVRDPDGHNVEVVCHKAE